jgi:PAS domain S-box-containing protein
MENALWRTGRFMRDLTETRPLQTIQRLAYVWHMECNMGNRRRGKQWRKTKGWRSSWPDLLVSVTVLSCALVSFCLIWFARMEETLARTTQHLQFMRSGIDHALADSAANLRLLRVEAEHELARGGDRPAAGRRIATLRPAPDGFVTTHMPADLPARHASYLFGRGEIPPLDSPRALELSTALALVPLMAEMYELMPEVGRIRYLSRQGVANLYPYTGQWMSRSLYWDETFANARFAQLGPERNPERAMRWLDANLAPGNMGAMMTLAAPVYDAEGHYRAVVSLEFALPTLERFLNPPAPESGAEASVESGGHYLLDKDGQALLASGASGVARNLHLRDALPEKQKELASTIMAFQSNGCVRQGDFHICNENLREAPWRLVRVSDRKQYALVLRQMQVETAGLLLLCLLLAALGMYRRINKSMRVQNARYQRVVENLEQGLWGWNRETREFSASPRFDNLLGYAQGESPLRGPDWAAQVFEGDRAPIRTAARRLLRGRKPFHQIEFRARSKTGAWRWLLCQGRVAARDPNGRARLLSGTLTDITERREVEAELLLAKQEADRARHAAEIANIAKSRFLAAASHDLRQPLQANNLFISALARTALGAEQQKIVQHMMLATKTLGELLDTLLDISRLDAGMIVPQRAPVELYDIFQRLDNEFALLAMEKKLRFKLFFPARPLILLTDLHLLLGLLRNLVSNAIRYTDWGGLLVGARLRGDALLIQVWDTGIGIKKEFIPRIYEEFFQIDNLQRDRSQGLGLGLSIARRMADLLGYHLSCFSRYGRGSLFEVSIPLVADENLHDLPASSEVERRDVLDLATLNGCHCVLVENDPLVVDALDIWLKSYGVQTRCFCDSDSALRDPDIATADFFITDFRMSGEINGIDFLNAVRHRLQVPICAVILTGDAACEQLDVFSDLRWPVLHKPVQPDLLLATLARLWHERHTVKHERKS